LEENWSMNPNDFVAHMEIHRILIIPAHINVSSSLKGLIQEKSKSRVCAPLSDNVTYQ